MAAASRTEDPAVERVERHPVSEELAREPFRFEFFQAIRLLQRIYPERDPVGRFVQPAGEVARFGVNPGTAFPASQIQSLEMREDGPARMRVNFMGLTGPLGVLPLYYSELVRERIRARDFTTRDFFDIFNHRLISLFYQAWEKYRFTIAYERGERDRFSHHLLDLVGLGTSGLQDRQDVPDDSLLFYGGLLAMHARPAQALKQILADYFEVPVEIEQFVGAWYPMEDDALCRLGENESWSQKLGFGAVVGNEIWDQQSRVRVKLGPLSYDKYRDFLPGGSGNRELRALTKFFAGGEYDLEVQLILERGEVPDCEIGARENEGPQLGWTTWAKTQAFTRDPGDTILEL